MMTSWGIPESLFNNLYVFNRFGTNMDLQIISAVRKSKRERIEVNNCHNKGDLDAGVTRAWVASLCEQLERRITI